MTTTQERAARLTEEQRTGISVSPNFHSRKGDRDAHPHRRKSDNATAAPAQVTREEIAWIVFEAKAGPYLTHWPAVYSSSWTFKAADAIMSLLASRGLVKEG